MSPRTAMIVFSVGTTVGTGMFMMCNRQDDPQIIKLPKEARIVNSTDSDVWFDLPKTRSTDEWLRQIADLNGMHPKPHDYEVNDDYFRRSLDLDDGHFHARRALNLDGSDDLNAVLKGK